MNLDKETLKKHISIAARREPADIVIKNGKIVDVFNLTILETDVAIANGVIVGLGEYEGKQTIDASNKYICPGFIDGHVHIESAMVPPYEFAKVVLPHGVTTVIADPHEIANVAGIEGIQYMMEAAKDVPLNTFFMLPSCVPATPFENAGATLKADDLAPLYHSPSVLGLGEVMDYPSVYHHQDEMMDKILEARQRGACIDGHAAGVDASGINVYMTAGIRTDHECVTAEEALERLQRGMYVMLREGSAARDLKELLKAVNEKNARRCLFVTDDKHLDDLLVEGSIDYNIKLAIQEEIDPLVAIQMATLNAAECFGLRTKGAVAPGYDADILLLESLEDVVISKVFQAGKLVVDNGVCLPFYKNPAKASSKITDSIQIQPVTVDDLAIQMKGEQASVIEIIPNSIVTRKRRETVTVINHQFQTSIENDQLKLAVIERHRRTGNIGLGIVKGFEIKSGALASTVAHDSHNIVVAGANDSDMALAIETIRKMRGGLVVVREGKILARLALPIAGLISDKGYNEINTELEGLNKALKELGFTKNFNPFLTLSFLALPVIPELKLTDMGLFDVTPFKHVGMEEQ